MDKPKTKWQHPLEAFRPPHPYTSYGQWMYDTDPSYKAACDEADQFGTYVPPEERAMDKPREIDVDFGTTYILDEDGVLRYSKNTPNNEKVKFVEKEAYVLLERRIKLCEEALEKCQCVYIESNLKEFEFICHRCQALLASRGNGK